MNRYVVTEIASAGGISALLFALFPGNAAAVYAAVVLAYLILQLASAFAFCLAIYRGEIHEHRHSERDITFTVSRKARRNWLVMRHLRAYLTIARLS